MNEQAQQPVTPAEEPWPQVGGFVLAVLFGPLLFGLSLIPALILAYISFLAMFVVGVDDSYPSWTVVIFGWAAVVSFPLSLVFSSALARGFGIPQQWVLVCLYLGPACLLATYTVAV